jgi:hypothetical protein
MLELPAVVLVDVIPLCSPHGAALLAHDALVCRAYGEVFRERPELVEQGRQATFRAGTQVTVLNILRRTHAAGGAPVDQWLAPGPVPGCGVLIPRPAGVYALVTGECWDGDFVWAVIAGRCLGRMR